MLNPYGIEKEMVSSLLMIRSRLNDASLVIAHNIINKSAELGIPIEQDVREKCNNLITSYYPNTKAYVCKTCNKTFDDGRKLGGHVSRAHKDSDPGEYFQFEYFSKTPVKEENNSREPKKQRELIVTRSMEQKKPVKVEFDSPNFVEIKEERIDMFYSSEDEPSQHLSQHISVHLSQRQDLNQSGGQDFFQDQGEHFNDAPKRFDD